MGTNVDSIVEGNETFFLRLTNSTNAAIGGNGSGTATLVDTTPTVSVSDATAVEGAPSGVIRFRLTLSAPLNRPVSVTYHTESGTATGGTDFQVITNGQVNFATNSRTAFVDVPVFVDSIAEPAERFRLVLDGAVNAQIARGIGTTSPSCSTRPSCANAGCRRRPGWSSPR